MDAMPAEIALCAESSPKPRHETLHPGAVVGCCSNGPFLGVHFEQELGTLPSRLFTKLSENFFRVNREKFSGAIGRKATLSFFQP